jgi:spore coat polysaccharide biosynthesis protein SpsF
MKDSKITVMIQARTSSTRLPRKVLEFIDHKPMIWHVINRVKQIPSVEQIALITTTDNDDKILLDIANENKIIGFSGQKFDVLDRHYQCAKQINADPIIRITSDCPLIDPFLVEKILKFYLKNNYDYVSNIFPPSFPDGLDTEIFSFDALERAAKSANLASEREHVSPYITKNPSIFKIGNYENNQNLSDYRWTVDKPQDLEFVKTIYSRMKPKTIFSMDEVLNLISQEPTLMEIHKGSFRNEGYAKSVKNDYEIS